jgi:four helix bundle protein
MHNFRKLDIWIEARHLVKDVYSLTTSFPDKEKFGIISQIQRAVISIPANIAEGSAKSSNKDFSRFLEISLGSSFEVETFLILSYDLDYISEETLITIGNKLRSIQKKIYNFKEKLNSKSLDSNNLIIQ